MRVLALASKGMGQLEDAAAAGLPREEVEADLTFAGFIAFACKVGSALPNAALPNMAPPVMALPNMAPPVMALPDMPLPNMADPS